VNILLKTQCNNVEGKMEPENTLTETICYCFGYSTEDIRKDFSKNGHSTIMERIRNEKELGGCHCAVKNPKGR